MNISSNEQPNYTAEIIIALGYLLLFCLFVYTCAGFYYLTSTEEASSVENDFATSLPPITPSPHIPSNYQPGDSSLFKQDFDNNYDSWTDNQSPTGLEFKDGKMFFESQYEDNYALTACGSSQCVYLNQPYYLQADFSADKLTDEGFGVVFNMKRGRDDFFLFLINPA